MVHATRTEKMINVDIPYFNWDNLEMRQRWRWENNDKIRFKEVRYEVGSSGPGYGQFFVIFRQTVGFHTRQ